MYEAWEMRHNDDGRLVRTREASRHCYVSEADKAIFKESARFPNVVFGLFSYSSVRGTFTPIYKVRDARVLEAS